MISGRLDELTGVLEARLVGEDTGFRGVATDTRQQPSGRLFVALRGANHDGHTFVADAARAGAAGAVVDRELDVPLAQLVVEDTRIALGRLAASWRERFQGRVMAVTGSNGKTTVKEMLASIFSRIGPVLATPGNLNNDIGLPLTLCDLTGDERAAVLEMGANHPGEIEYLTGIARPDVGVVTNAGAAHLEGFGSLEGVARAKGELFAGLPAGGVAVINRDDRFHGLWREMAGSRRILTFGLSADADVRADPDGIETRIEGRSVVTRFVARCPGNECEIRLTMPGEHNVRNALAAAAVAVAAGVDLEQVRVGLETTRTTAGRLGIVRGREGAILVDDTYNANPSSLEVALGVLGRLDRRRWLVLGDMGELGEAAGEMHAEAGRRAREVGVERLFGVGPLAAHAVEAFGEGGLACADTDEAVRAASPGLSADLAVLVKGSRSMRMERVVRSLEAPEQRQPQDRGPT